MVLRIKLLNVELRTVHIIPCGVPGQNVMSHVEQESYQDHEHAITVSQVSTAWVTNTIKQNVTPPTKVSPCGLIGPNVRQPVVVVICQDREIIFAPIRLMKRQSRVMNIQEHGRPGVNGQHARQPVVAVKHSETEFIRVLANEPNK